MIIHFAGSRVLNDHVHGKQCSRAQIYKLILEDEDDVVLYIANTSIAVFMLHTPLFKILPQLLAIKLDIQHLPLKALSLRRR
jgi:hypothetical protein